MRPIGHLFRVFSSDGQRDISWPAELAEHHQGHVTAQIVRGIQGEAARGLVYGDLAVIKTVTAEFAYLNIVETIQDAFGRMSPSVHSMALPVADLISENRALVPPQDKDSYLALVIPSQVHARRLLTDIRAAIDRLVAGVDVPTTEAHTNWAARELNYLLNNRNTSIWDLSRDDSPEVPVGEFLAKIPPIVSAGLSFAVKCIPRGNFNVAIYPPNVQPAPSTGLTLFRGLEEFRQALEATPSEPVLDDGKDAVSLVALTQWATGQTLLTVLGAFREGLRRGNPNTTVAANMIAQALQSNNRGTIERALEALEADAVTIEGFPEQDKEIVRQVLGEVQGLNDSANRKRHRIMLEMSSELVVPSPPQPAASPPDPAPSDSQEDSGSLEPSRTNNQVSERAGSSASVSAAGSTDARRENANAGPPGIPPQPRSWDDIDEPAEVLAELKNIIGQDPSTGIEVVAQGIKRFTELVTKAGAGAPKGRQLSDLVQDIWQELHRWEKQGNHRENRRSQIISLLKTRDHPAAPSLFDELMYVTRRSGNRGKHSKTLTLYERMIGSILEIYGPGRRGLWRK